MNLLKDMNEWSEEKEEMFEEGYWRYIGSEEEEEMVGEGEWLYLGYDWN